MEYEEEMHDDPLCFHGLEPVAKEWDEVKLEWVCPWCKADQ